MSVDVESRPAAVTPGRSIMFLPADKTGCGLYRMILPARQAINAGRGHRVDVAAGIKGVVQVVDGKPIVRELPQLQHSILVFQRPFDWIVAQCIPIAQQQGVACVVELDDDVRNVHPANMAHYQVQPKNSPLSNWQHVLDACAAADWVTVSTPALANYAPHGRVSVIPNTVPASMTTHQRQPRGGPVRVGWTGAIATHPTDLQETLGQVARAVDDTGAQFHVVGDGTGVKDALRLSAEPSATGWLPLTRYPEAVAELDVGIVPLAKTPFNAAKSWLKGLEMGALGVPFVASPLPEYVRLAEEYGIGEIATRPKDWYRLVRRLIDDADYRADLGARYRARVAAALTTDHVGGQWMDAWENAFQHRRSVRRG